MEEKDMWPVYYPPSSPIAGALDSVVTTVEATSMARGTWEHVDLKNSGNNNNGTGTYTHGLAAGCEFENSGSESDSELFKGLKKDSPAFSKSTSSDLHLWGDFQRNSAQKIYPTPVPSSSTGYNSSPVKLSTTQQTEREETEAPFSSSSHNNINENKNPNENTLELTPPASTKHQDSSISPQNYVVHPTILKLTIEPNSTSKITIGRQSGICDFQLPSYKTISRRHASISYIPHLNQLRLECYGSNGIRVEFPKRLIDCALVRPVRDMPNVFELVGRHTTRLLEKLRCESFFLVDDNTESKKGLGSVSTSFFLRKGESVLMPFMDGTVLDFRQVRVSVSMDHDCYDSDNNNNNSGNGYYYYYHRHNYDYWGDTSDSDDVSVESGCDNEDIDESISLDMPRISNSLAGSRKRYRSSTHGPHINPRWKRPLRFKVVDLTPKGTLLNEPTRESLPKTRSDVHNLKDTVHMKHRSKLQKQTTSFKQKKVKRTADEILASLREKNIDITEIQHVLVNHLAFGNSLQIPLSQIRSVSSQIRTLQKDELRYVLSHVRCIGIIYRQGKDAAGKPLEEEYFYDMEKDDDVQRKNLVSAMKGGRSELRSCRRTHKQYFWKKPT